MFGSKMFGSKRRYGYNSYFKPYKRSRWGSTYGKSVGSAKAAKTGNKISYYNAQTSGYLNFAFASGSFTSDVHTFLPFTARINMTGSGSTATYALVEERDRHGAAVADKGFRLMCAMNDECRLCRMTVRLQPATSIPSNAAIRLYSIIDRNETAEEFGKIRSDDAMSDDTITAQSLIDNQGAVIQTFNSNRVSPLFRTSVPTDVKEKTSWSDCSIVYTDTVGASPLYRVGMRGWDDGSCTYAPAIHFACQSSIAASADSVFTFGYTVEYSFAFRNPKSGIDKFIRWEQVGYVNPAAAKASRVPVKTEKGEEDSEPGKAAEVVEEVEDHDPGTS